MIGENSNLVIIKLYTLNTKFVTRIVGKITKESFYIKIESFVVFSFRINLQKTF